MESINMGLTLKKKNPIWLITVPWVLVYLLWTLNLTSYTQESKWAELLALSLIAGPILGFYFYSLLLMRRENSNKLIGYVFFVDENNDPYFKIVRSLCVLFFCILISEFLIFGYVPLFSLIAGASVDYFAFGIPGLHGFLYALGLSIISIAFLLYRTTKNKIYLLILVFVAVSFLLIVTRKAFIIAIVQMAIIFLLTNKKKFNIFIIFFAFLTVYIFGFVGDVRTGRDVILSLAALRTEYPDWLPSGFIWVYLYIVTPFANLLSIIEHTIPTYSLEFLAGDLVPKFLLTFLFDTDYTRGGEFNNSWQISGAFNVATGYAGSALSLSIFGPLIYGFLLGFALRFTYFSKNIWIFLIYVSLLTAFVFMPFNDNFTSLNFIFQIPIYIFLYKKYKKLGALAIDHAHAL